MTATTPDLAALLAQLAKALAEHQRPNTEPAPHPLPERVLLTVEEAAERLGIGRSMAFRLIRDREIESVKIGRLRRVPASAVTEYAARLVAGEPKNARIGRRGGVHKMARTKSSRNPNGRSS